MGYIKCIVLALFAFIIMASVIQITEAQEYNIIRLSEVSNITLEELESFLQADKTDEHEYTSSYNCGYFARDLARNASKQNLTIGGVILGYNPSFRGYNNHITSYVYVNGNVQFIEPQSDRIFTFNQSGYHYFKLYPNGKYVPSRW